MCIQNLKTLALIEAKKFVWRERKMDPKLGALTARSLLLYYGYVLGRVLKCVWNGVGI